MLPENFTPQFLSRLELLKVRARRAYLGQRQGGHLSLKRGHGIEFSDYRRYELGDSPRHIDWGLYARSERLYVKRFQEEQNLSVLLVVDGSASMRTPAEDKKWERARDIALSIAYVALMEQDSVAISVPGSFHSPATSGGRAIHRLADALVDIQLAESFDFERELQRAVSRIRFPGIAVFISDFLMPVSQVERLTTIMRMRSLDVTAIQVLGAQDEDPLPQRSEVIAIDSESGQEVELRLTPETRRDYEELLAAHGDQLKRLFAQSRIPFVVHRSHSDLAEFVMQGLPRMGLFQ